MTATELGSRSAATAVVVGIMYAVALAIGVAQSGLSTPIVDPVLAIVELLTIASALPLLLLFVARHACVATAQRI